MRKKIKVLIVDDSAVVRQILTQVLEKDPQIEILGVAADPIFAMNRMKKEWPDVIVCDVEMPRMDGLTFLKKIMQERPTPVVICSSLTTKGAQTTIQAMAFGAVAIVTKPQMGVKSYLEDRSNELVREVKTAAMANLANVRATPQLSVSPKLDADAVLSSQAVKLNRTTDRIVALGTSTGGTQALEAVLKCLPRTSPGIVVVQHMPEKFTAAFAERLNTVCQVEVKEAATGDRIINGRVLIAPGGKHLCVVRNGAQYQTDIKAGPPVNRHRPSVDVLFRSVAQHAGKNALGIIMTGMGDDGAKGLLELKNTGAPTIGQDEKTCVVYGMPKEAMKLGAVGKEIPLQDIPSAIMEFVG